jgi:hypothetical protein
MSNVTSRDRRAVFLGAAILLPALLFIWGVRPFLSAVRENRDLLASERATLSRELAAIEAARTNPDLHRVADSAMRAVAPRLFEGRDSVMATAELGSYLGDIAARHDVWLQNAVTRPSVAENGGVRRLRVEIRAESDLQGVLSFITALERGEKLLRVERLDISRVLAVGSDEGIEPVTIAATIVGFALPDAPAGSATGAPSRNAASSSAGAVAAGGTR